MTKLYLKFQILRKKLLNAVKETSIDCSLHNNSEDGDLVCYGFGESKPDKFAYIPSFDNQEDDKVDNINKITKITNASVWTIKGVRYAVDNDTKDVYDLDSFLKARDTKKGNPIKLGRIVEENGNMVLKKIV